MFKLVVLFALLALAAARPSHIASRLVYSGPAVAVHGPGLTRVVKTIPTTLSHQSPSIVYSSAPAVRTHYAAAGVPLVQTTYAASAPVVRTHYAAAGVPLVQTTYAASAPVIRTVAPVVRTYAAAPAFNTLGTSFVPAGSHLTYGATPLTYSANGAW